MHRASTTAQWRFGAACCLGLISPWPEATLRLRDAMDKLTPSQRSANMARIGAKDTSPELAVRQLLHRLGFRFRLHRTDLPGRPDIVMPGRNTIILVHGCFWHRHSKCRFAYTPKSRTDFWKRKFDANLVRDRRVQRALRGRGWRVYTVWECETRRLDKLQTRLLKLLSNGR